MSDDDPLSLRVYSQADGTVCLLYEPENWCVVVDKPVTEQTLAAAVIKLRDHGKAELKKKELAAEGESEENVTLEQRANRQIKAVVVPQPRNRLQFVSRLTESFFEGLILLVCIGALTFPLYKLVELSQKYLPEALHLIILLVVGVCLAFSIHSVATRPIELQQSTKFRYWFGTAGLLVLSCLNLVGAASVFAYLTLSLYNHQQILLEPCAGRAVGPSSLLDFYMWHLLKLVPLLKLNETLKWGEPLCYTEGKVGFLILLFQALVVLPCINAIRLYFKNRDKLAAKPYKYIYEPGWRPESNLEP